MQDRYTGDVDDFLKLGLLRWLVSPSPYGQKHRLGVVWFQEPGDGERVAVEQRADLDPSTRAGQELRSLDSILYDKLRIMVCESGGAVSAREAWRALPADTLCFDRPLTFDDVIHDDHAARTVSRQRWFHEAMVAVSPCSLVFLDSDHVADTEAEDVSLPEIEHLLQRGQSVVTHHLTDPSQPVRELVTSHMNAIHETLGVEPLAVVRDVKGGAHLFTVIPHHCHRSDFRDRIGALQLSNWGEAFRVYRWHRELASA